MKRILHMDNEEDTLSSVKTILEKEGYEVTSVTTSKKAEKEADLDDYDLVLLNITMPDLSGWDVFTRLMKIRPDIKIIFLTTLKISPERQEHLVRHGIADYILKPFDRDDFVGRVKKVLGE